MFSFWPQAAASASSKRTEQIVLQLKKTSNLLSMTFEVLLNRCAAAYKVDEAVKVFESWREFGIDDDVAVFHGLLMWFSMSIIRKGENRRSIELLPRNDVKRNVARGKN
ncbi:hypothetical protein F2Q69_00038311 [Brassica cretica]|uniref:Pentacotripeptide-repeat region of PRORP domain-containing protein n=1 Tax=Brassica cretica TaxID=69181 RepID=A0A8S9SRQ0_BRACR|nr:hypothetical protein F2Q69_00038311 [Brassica cretica]